MGAGTGHSSKEEAAAGGRQVTTTHKPTKIRAGEYEYRGVNISKYGKAFSATAFTVRGWHRVGYSTLKDACDTIDLYIDARGFKVENGTLRDPARFL